jgi:hypothetical protein
MRHWLSGIRIADFTSKMHICDRVFTPCEGTTRRVNADRGAEIYQAASDRPCWRWRASGRDGKLALPYLPEMGVAAELAQRFGEGTLSAELARVLRSCTAGNPLFLALIVHELGQRGILREGAGCEEGAEGLKAAMRGVPEPAPLICGRRGAAPTSGVPAACSRLAAVCRRRAVGRRNAHYFLFEWILSIVWQGHA